VSVVDSEGTSCPRSNDVYHISEGTLNTLDGKVTAYLSVNSVNYYDKRRQFRLPVEPSFVCLFHSTNDVSNTDIFTQSSGW
jgi:hypothetical protein